LPEARISPPIRRSTPDKSGGRWFSTKFTPKARTLPPLGDVRRTRGKNSTILFDKKEPKILKL